MIASARMSFSRGWASFASDPGRSSLRPCLTSVSYTRAPVLDVGPRAEHAIRARTPPLIDLSDGGDPGTPVEAVVDRPLHEGAETTSPEVVGMTQHRRHSVHRGHALKQLAGHLARKAGVELETVDLDQR